jgi:hypothetical protein
LIRKNHKIENYSDFELVKIKKINLVRIIKLSTRKILIKLSKIWVWDPRSRIRNKPIPDPGIRGQKGPGSATLVLRVLFSFSTCSSGFWREKDFMDWGLRSGGQIVKAL